MLKIALYFLLLAGLGANGEDFNDFKLNSEKFAGALYTNAPSALQQKSFLFGPYSLQVLLGMTQSGARGKTGEQIRNSSFLSDTQQDVETIMKEVITTVSGTLANKVFTQKDYPLNSDFQNVAKDVYKSTFENVEFLNPPSVVTTINSWASQYTNNIFSNASVIASDFTTLTKDVLINTYYANIDWSFPFDTNETVNENFFNGTANVIVKMMNRGPTEYNYYESSELDAKFLEIPLNAEDMSLTIVLPNQNNGLPKIDEKIDLAVTTPAYSRERIQLGLPITKIKFSHLIVNDTLTALGMQDPFIENQADLGGLNGGNDELVLNSVIQNSYLSFNETNLEAANGGYTGVWLNAANTFTVNRPFLMYVKVKGVVVMIARVINPGVTA